jgi:hypothetical protein
MRSPTQQTDRARQRNKIDAVQRTEPCRCHTFVALPLLRQPLCYTCTFCYTFCSSRPCS